MSEWAAQHGPAEPQAKQVVLRGRGRKYRRYLPANTQRLLAEDCATLGHAILDWDAYEAAPGAPDWLGYMHRDSLKKMLRRTRDELDLGCLLHMLPKDPGAQGRDMEELDTKESLVFLEQMQKRHRGEVREIRGHWRWHWGPMPGADT